MTNAPAVSARTIPLGPTACLTSGPDGWWLANPNDFYIGRSLMHYGVYSPEEIALCMRLLAPGDEVVEGGSNIGTLTRWMAPAVGPTGRIYSFEPQRIIYQMLCANLALAGIENVHHFRSALGARSGELRFPKIDYARMGNFGGAALSTDADGESAHVVRLDDVLSLSSLKLLKLDVEGAELMVLEGAAQTIERLQPFIYLEADRVDQAPALIRRLKGWGYALFWHTPDLYSADNPRNESINLLGNVSSINILAVPSNRSNPCPELAPVADDQDHPLKREQRLPGLSTCNSRGSAS